MPPSSLSPQSSLQYFTFATLAAAPCHRHRARAALPRHRPFRRLVSVAVLPPALAADRAVASYRHRSSAGHRLSSPRCASVTPLPLDGVLSPKFMVGRLIGSPIFASLAKSYSVTIPCTDY
ncbi:hypothetical protein PIB30_064614 [Stylosanthes scabra]|uniref:Uncharacterized protein n=1 Tax=Stylosanthes scabra TaxID=79078 RepID=A0ABU6SN73_9FABA|nr:hypothetical protein [Stylosanthes scabra]